MMLGLVGGKGGLIEITDLIEDFVCGFLAACSILDGLKSAAKLREERWHNIVCELA